MPSVLRRHHLRHACLVVLADARRPLRVRDVVAELQADGFTFAGRPTQAVSDALRAEVGHGRVGRTGWGEYVALQVEARHLRYARTCVRELRQR